MASYIGALQRALLRSRQGSCRGPGKGLAAVPAVIPDKALVGGLVVLLGWDSAKDHHLLKWVSDLECLHKDLHATTGMSPESFPHGGSGLKGGFAPYVWGELPRQGSCRVS